MEDFATTIPEVSVDALTEDPVSDNEAFFQSLNIAMNEEASSQSLDTATTEELPVSRAYNPGSQIISELWSTLSTLAVMQPLGVMTSSLPHITSIVTITNVFSTCTIHHLDNMEKPAAQKRRKQNTVRKELNAKLLSARQPQQILLATARQLDCKTTLCD